MKNTGRCYVQDIHGGSTSAALEDAIRSADIKLKECVERRERLLAELRDLDSAITYQEATKAKRKAELAALLAPGELRIGRNLKQKMLDDLVAQQAAIAQKIKELEAESADPYISTEGGPREVRLCEQQFNALFAAIYPPLGA